MPPSVLGRPEGRALCFYRDKSPLVARTELDRKLTHVLGDSRFC
jgi:hypothetical protein